MDEPGLSSPNSKHRRANTTLNTPVRKLKHTNTFTSKKPVCCVCATKFGFRNKKKVCSKCELPVCQEHSGGDIPKKQERVCNTCRAEDIRNKTYLVDCPERESLNYEYERVREDTQKKVKIVKELDTQLASVNSQLLYKTKNSEASLTALHEKLQLQRQRNIAEAEKLENLKKLLKKAQESEENERNIVNRNLENIEIEKKELEMLNGDLGRYQAEFKELVDFIDGKIEFSVLTKNLCNMCNKKIRYLIMTAKASINSKNGGDDPMVKKPCCVVF